MIRLAARRLGSNAYTNSVGSAAAKGNVVSPSCAPTSIQTRRYERDLAHLPNVSRSVRRCTLRTKVATSPQRLGAAVDSPLLTIFSAPKAFKGHIGIIQENAIRSWLSLHPKPKIILFSNEAGTAEVVRRLNVQLVTEVAANAFGTPLVSHNSRPADV